MATIYDGTILPGNCDHHNKTETKNWIKWGLKMMKCVVAFSGYTKQLRFTHILQQNLCNIRNLYDTKNIKTNHFSYPCNVWCKQKTKAPNRFNCFNYIMFITNVLQLLCNAREAKDRKELHFMMLWNLI